MKISVLTPSIRPQFLDTTQYVLERQTFQDFEWIVEIGLRSRGFTLPADWNRMLKRARGEIIVFLQDCITIPEDALSILSALDHDRKAYTFPLQRSDGTYDWRQLFERANKKTKVTPNMWEIDLGSAPTALFHDVGGFDEEYCKGWSWENVEIAWRAAAAGYEFHVSHAIEGKVVDHDKLVEHPFRNKMENNDKRSVETMRRAERGDFKLNFL